MSTTLLTAGNSSTRGDGGSCMETRASCTLAAIHFAITDVLKAKFPLKTWAHLASMLNLQERAAKYRISNSRGYTVEELQVLIQSEDGLEFLNALMADAEPRWWWWAKRVMAIAARRRQAAELDQEIMKLETSRPAETGARRRIKGDLDAKQNLGAKFARAETSLGFLAPEQDRASRSAMVQAPAQTRPAPRAYAGRER